MLIKLTLEDAGAGPLLIGAPIPTVDLYTKVDSVLSVLPNKDHKDRCEITVVGIPKVLTCMESPDSLAKRINDLYLQMGRGSSFTSLESAPTDGTAN